MNSYFDRILDRDPSGSEPIIQPIPLHPYETLQQRTVRDPFATPDHRPEANTEAWTVDQTDFGFRTQHSHTGETGPAETEPHAPEGLEDPSSRDPVEHHTPPSSNSPFDLRVGIDSDPASLYPPDPEDHPRSDSGSSQSERVEGTGPPDRHPSQPDPSPGETGPNLESPLPSIDTDQTHSPSGPMAETAESEPAGESPVAPTTFDPEPDRTSWQNRFGLPRESSPTMERKPEHQVEFHAENLHPDEPPMVSPSIQENDLADDTPGGNSRPDLYIDRINVTIRKNDGVRPTPPAKSSPDQSEHHSLRQGWTPKIRFGLGQL